ncbi:unnamed protein product [Lactuca virosa]|uniref:Uncharacterized protein n=1 Tax=Lactuca virosa TaxID=75947 RepID=A0AAU9MKA7_9ASTR|nr:unnamed protein product [Lactuca virosa]
MLEEGVFRRFGTPIREGETLLCFSGERLEHVFQQSSNNRKLVEREREIQTRDREERRRCRRRKGFTGERVSSALRLNADVHASYMRCSGSWTTILTNLVVLICEVCSGTSGFKRKGLT